MEDLPELEGLPAETITAARNMLAEGRRNVYQCGDTGVFGGYWVESHTLGCRKEAGDPDLWHAHWAVYDEYEKDGKSLLVGDPADGVFISISPIKLAGMGAELLIELGRRIKKTITLAQAEAIVDRLYPHFLAIADPVLVAGSIRRRRPQIGDIEFVVLPKDEERFFERLADMGFEGGDRIQKKIEKGVPIEIYIAHKPEELGALLFMYTGDWQHNIAMRSIAKRKGWKLDQYGITDAKTSDVLLQSPDERDFYDFLGVEWHDPEDRSFKDRPKKKKASMGAELLIELGREKRSVGYIHLALMTPDEERSDCWTLHVERVDPFGGDAWTRDFLFDSEETARYWFSQVKGDEDLDLLIQHEEHQC